MKFPKITSEMKTFRDSKDNLNTGALMDYMAELPIPFGSDNVAGGASNSNADHYVFVAPTKCQILDAKFIVDTPNVGTGNTPVVSLRAGSTEIAVSEAIALSGSKGDVEALVIDADNAVVEAGTAVYLRVATPESTVGTAIKGRLQAYFKSVA